MDPTLLGALFALGSAASWGVGDFAGGLATKRAKVWGVVLVSNGAGALLLVALALLTREPLPLREAALWSMLAAVGSIVGLTSLYHGLAVGRMGVVAPVSAVVTAIVPVVVSAFLEGPPGLLAYGGFALALAGIALVSYSREAGTRGGVGLGILAGLGFGVFLVAIERATGEALWWPLVIARVTALVALALVVLVGRRDARIPIRVWPLAIAAVALDTTANALFAFSARVGRLDVAGVLSSMYPAVTVMLALFVLKERVTWVQAAGIACLLGAVALIVS